MARQNHQKKTGKVVKINSLGLTLSKIEPMTFSQRQVFEYWHENHLVLHGIAGTGKTFCAMYLALREILEYGNFRRVVVIRSAVPTRDIGFMPGSLEEKLSVYEVPYKDITNHLCGRGDAYDILKNKHVLEFMSTSFVRGLTMDNSIVIVDECQSMNFHELDSVMTRIGNGSKIVFCGDYRQSDLKNEKERSGIHDFLKIIEKIKGIERIEFAEQDIVRGELVKAYILAKLEHGII